MKKSNIIITYLVAGLLYSLASGAASLPNYYPANFRMWGVLDRLDIKTGEAVINDMKVTLSDNIHVYTLSSQFSSVQSLQTGMKVGFAMPARGNGTPIITEIWVLPDDYHYPSR